MVLLRLSGRRARGRVALLDDEDRHLAARSWHLDSEGYPADGRRVRLHRAVLGAPPQPGLVVDHRNENKLDCRRENLEWVPQLVNARRHTAKRTHCRRGHPITRATTYVDSRGKRDCLVCRRERDRARRGRAG